MAIYSRLPPGRVDIFSDAHTQCSSSSMLAVPVDRGSAQVWGGPCQMCAHRRHRNTGEHSAGQSYPWAHESEH